MSRLVRDLQHLGRRRLAEVNHVAMLFIEDRDALEPMTLVELRMLMRERQVTILDVRPREEYQAGHIPGAISMPVAALRRQMGDLPRRREIIAYCRGPYCVFALEAVTLLRKHGFRARRAAEGLPEWRGAGFPVVKAM